MGTVFKARWTRRGVEVAVKLLRASELSAADYAAATAALAREAELLRLASEGGTNRFVVPLLGIAHGAPSQAWVARLGHELALYASRGGGADTGAGASAGAAPAAPALLAGELFGIVMAWLPGGSLAKRLHGAPVRWAASSRTAERLLLLERVAEGVALLHSAEPTLVVHGDIKSENVLLTAEGEPRLSDFGLAEVRRAAADSLSAVSVRAGVESAAGTFAYMAPELYRTRAVAALAPSRSTDVYALGTLCWETLVGERPWAGFDAAERLTELRTGAGLDWARLPTDVPVALRALLERSVALERAERPSARELCEGLRAARELLESGRYDVFLSHAWDNAAHAPATVFVRQALHNAGRRVWVDSSEMGHDLAASMRAGVAASTVFVALVSCNYAKSVNCMLELRAAVALGKPIVTCLVEPGDVAWWPSVHAASSDTEREMAAAVNSRALLLADLRRACAAGGWGELAVGAGGAGAAADTAAAAAAVPAELLALLNAPEAVPRLLLLVTNVIERGPAAAATAAQAARDAAGLCVAVITTGPNKGLLCSTRARQGCRTCGRHQGYAVAAVCSGKKRSGQQCSFPARFESGFCGVHDPAFRAARRQAAQSRSATSADAKIDEDEDRAEAEAEEEEAKVAAASAGAATHPGKPRVLRAATLPEEEARATLWQHLWGKHLSLPRLFEREGRLRAHAWSASAKREVLLLLEEGSAAAGAAGGAADVLASCELYSVTATLDGEPASVLLVATLFTAEERRRRGHAEELLEAVWARAASREGCAGVLLFSDIGAAYYERLGFRHFGGAVDIVLPADASAGSSGGDGVSLAATLADLDEAELNLAHAGSGGLAADESKGASEGATACGLLALPVELLRVGFFAELERFEAEEGRPGRGAPLAHRGARCGARAACAWAADFENDELLVLALSASGPLEAAALLAAAQREAAAAGLAGGVRLWEAAGASWSCEDVPGARREPRKGHMPMVRPVREGAVARLALQRVHWW
jgi:serine/threonine protein kinase/GNAT superfamily N-acetyltransferase